MQPYDTTGRKLAAAEGTVRSARALEGRGPESSFCSF
jgi:hypothetical protein